MNRRSRASANALVEAAVAIGVIITLAFVLVAMSPGDPARMILGPRASEESVQVFRHRFDLDATLRRRYVAFAWRALHMDFGESYVRRQPVTTIVLDGAATSGRLMLGGGLVILIAGIGAPLTFRVLRWDRARAVWRWATSVTAVIPPYVLALSVLVAAARLGWTRVVFDPERLASWLLPVLVLAAFPTGVLARLLDVELDRILAGPFIMRARAFGAPWSAVVLREALPNVIPVVASTLTNGVAFLATGSLFVEVVFGIGGVGRLTYEAVRTHDIALLIGATLFASVAVVSASTIARLAEPLVAP